MGSTGRRRVEEWKAYSLVGCFLKGHRLTVTGAKRQTVQLSKHFLCVSSSLTLVYGSGRKSKGGEQSRTGSRGSGGEVDAS